MATVKWILEQMLRWRAGGVGRYGLLHRISSKLYSIRCPEAREEYMKFGTDDQIRFRIVTYMQKKYKKKLPTMQAEVEKECLAHETKSNKTIWMLWWQGIQNAPEIVKACYHSVLDNLGNQYDVVVLDKNNYKSYVDLPKDISDKILSGKFYFQKGQIALQFLSDLIRLSLLIKHGGIWMDATMYCTTDRVPNYIENADLFLYQVLFPSTWVTSTTMESWFIKSTSNNRILRLLQKILYDYIRTNTILADYLFIYVAMELVKKCYHTDFLRIPPVSNTGALCLQNYLFEKFDPDIFDVILRQSDFHKLTWKGNGADLEKEGTFYQHILNQDRIQMAKIETIK